MMRQFMQIIQKKYANQANYSGNLFSTEAVEYVAAIYTETGYLGKIHDYNHDMWYVTLVMLPVLSMYW